MSEQTSRVVFDTCTYNLQCEKNKKQGSQFEFSRYDFGLRINVTQTEDTSHKQRGNMIGMS